jgi:hypothetical protein
MILISVALISGREDYAEQPIAGEARYVGTGIKEQLAMPAWRPSSLAERK